MPRRYSASDLRQRVELLSKVSTPDGGGGSTEVYAPLSPPVVLSAKVEPMSASERFNAGQMESAERLLVVIRYRPGLNQSMRVSYGSRQFEIVGMIDLEHRHQWLELTCEERFGE